MELRPATREEFDDFDRAVMPAFHREVTDEDRRHYERIDEPERSLAWFDDGRIVAATGIYTRQVTVPGAIVPCAAVTAVGVVPTHRRRGLLTAMMRRQLEDVHARRRAGRDPVGVGGRDLRALRLRHRGAHRSPDRAPPDGAPRGAAPARRAAARGPGGRARRGHARGLRARPRRAPGDARPPRAVVGRSASTTRSPSATAPSRCRPSSCPTATRSTRCAPTATTTARRAR